MVRNKHQSEEKNQEASDESDSTPSQPVESAGLTASDIAPAYAADTDTPQFHGEATPFSLDDMAAQAESLPVLKGAGQFSGDDLEFESFMFDQGDDINLQPASAPEADEAPIITGEPVPAPGPLEISGQEVPLPSFVGAFIPDAGTQPVQPALQISDYPRVASGWSDQMLASVDDFSQVLFALRSEAQVETRVPPLAVVEATAAAAASPVATEAASEGAVESWTAAGDVEEAVEEPERAAGPTGVEEVVEPFELETIEELPQEPDDEGAILAEAMAGSAGAGMTGEAGANDTAWLGALVSGPLAVPEDAGEATREGPDEAADVATAEGAVAAEATDSPEAAELVGTAEAAEAAESVEVEPPQVEYVNEMADVDQPAGAEAAPFEENESGEPESVAAGEAWAEQVIEEEAEEGELAAAAPVPVVEEAEVAPEVALVEEAAPQMEAAIEEENVMPEQPEMAAPPDEAMEEAAHVPGTDEAESSPYVASLDMDLPPWLQESAEFAPEIAGILEPAPTGEEAPAQMEQGPDAATGEEAFQMPDMTGISAREPDQPAEEAGASTWMSAAGVAIEGEHDPTQFDHPVAEGDLAPAPSGEFAGESLEFENFMFDEGAHAPLPVLPNIGDLMPAVRGMEPALDVAARPDTFYRGEGHAQPGPIEGTAEVAEANAEPLPFWLTNADEGGAVEEPEVFPNVEQPIWPWATETGEIGVEAGGIGTGTVNAGLTAPTLESVEEYDDEEDLDFAELPPIEPFDFSVIPVPEQEESLGFNTEELAGAIPNSYDPMMATANLDVLADLLGKDRTSGVLDVRAITQGVDNLLGAAPAGRQSPPRGEQAEYAESAGQRITGGLPEGDEAQETGWSAGEDETGRFDGNVTERMGEQLTGAMPVDSLPGTGTEELTVADLDVAPFDITELELDAEDVGTGYLSSSHLGTEEPAHEHTGGKIFTDTLFARPRVQQPKNWDAPEWMDGEQQANTADMDTSRFAPSASAESQSSPEFDMATEQLSGRQEHHAHTAEANLPESIFKVKVSRFKVPESDLLGAGSGSAGGVGMRTPVAAQSQPASAGAGGGPFGKPPASANVSLPLNSSILSGPLPELQGFHQLQELLAGKPDDLGAHLALAVAYSQSGHLDHALYEYRQLLKRRQVPVPMLQMIEEQLSDLEEEAGSQARFHQVRGDLYMKQGRYQEAIEEYNKLN